MKTHTVLLGVLVWAGLFDATHGRPPTVPLAENCEYTKLDLRPNTGHPHVSVLVSKTTYSPNTRITVTLQAKVGESFTGFRLVARSSKYKLEEAVISGYGSFLGNSETATVICEKTKDQSALIHSDVNCAKTRVTVTWVAPSEFGDSPPGDLKFWAAISQHNETYWVPFESNEIHFKESVCIADKNNCFRYPDACADDECDVMVGWQVDGDYVSFGATALVFGNERYLAVGFSTTGTMAPSPTVNCVRSATTSDVEITSGANLAERDNRPLSPPSLGLHPTMSGEYVDGRITCRFSYIKSKSLLRSLVHHQSDRDLLADLTNNKYYLLAAMGEVNAEGKLQYHGIAKVVNPNFVNFTASSSKSVVDVKSSEIDINRGRAVNKLSNIYKHNVCENENKCFRYPKNCADAACEVLVGWKVDGDYVKFSASGSLIDNERYLAIGFSSYGLMSPSPTVDCIRDPTTSAVEIKSAANEERNNRFLSPPSLGLHPTMSGEYVDGRITCHFSYIKSKSQLHPSTSEKQQSDEDLLADLTKNKYYLIAAKGNMENGLLVQHRLNVVNPVFINFTDSGGKSEKRDICDNKFNCFRIPENCAGDDCQVMVGWRLDGDYVKFDATAKTTNTDRYLAVGFSLMGTMSPSPTVNCVRSETGAMVEIKSAANKERTNRVLSPSSLGLHPTMSGEYADGRITCHFSYVKSRSLAFSLTEPRPHADKDLLADLANNKYYMIVAIGPVNPDGSLTFHDTNKFVNPEAINFTDLPPTKAVTVPVAPSV